MKWTVGVAGSGTMGTGIAIVAARSGHPTRVFDLSQDSLSRAREQTESFLGNSVRRGKLTEGEAEAALARMLWTMEMEDLGDCDAVIEATFEDLSVKTALVAQLDRVCRATTIFATNTSTLSVTEIAAASALPERVVGMHFCLPAQLMKLVEVTPGLTTSAETVAAARALCEEMGQISVVTRDSPGFVLNYFVVPFNNDAIRLVERGVAEPTEIDAAVKAGLGYPMGPLELLDLIGLDTQVRLCEALYPITRDPRAAAPPLLRRMVAAGRLGRKTGHGFHRYDDQAIFGASR